MKSTVKVMNSYYTTLALLVIGILVYINSVSAQVEGFMGMPSVNDILNQAYNTVLRKIKQWITDKYNNGNSYVQGWISYIKGWFSFSQKIMSYMPR
jgi:hypothetical protein